MIVDENWFLPCRIVFIHPFPFLFWWQTKSVPQHLTTLSTTEGGEAMDPIRHRCSTLLETSNFERKEGKRKQSMFNKMDFKYTDEFSILGTHSKIFWSCECWFEVCLSVRFCWNSHETFTFAVFSQSIKRYDSSKARMEAQKKSLLDQLNKENDENEILREKGYDMIRASYCSNVVVCFFRFFFQCKRQAFNTTDFMATFPSCLLSNVREIIFSVQSLCRSLEVNSIPF